jgi:hypothetical protein
MILSFWDNFSLLLAKWPGRFLPGHFRKSGRVHRTSLNRMASSEKVVRLMGFPVGLVQRTLLAWGKISPRWVSTSSTTGARRNDRRRISWASSSTAGPTFGHFEVRGKFG